MIEGDDFTTEVVHKLTNSGKGISTEDVQDLYKHILRLGANPQFALTTTIQVVTSIENEAKK